MQTLQRANSTVSTQKKLKLSISKNERQRRLIAWEKSLANFALEDIHPTEDMKRIGFMYINGEITLKEQSEMMRASILNDESQHSFR